jgi:phage shock protein PspC (stress-responsive transcriptional regulator)
MQTPQPSVFARDHTMFGVCEALGEDLGFSPVFLRIAFAVGLFFSPAGAIALYAALGLLVAFTRLVSPVPNQAAAPEAVARQAEPVEAQPEPEMALAA